jgi:Fe-S oxidoreductase
MEIPGVTHFVVACPKDVNMYEAAVRATGFGERLKVVEITELIAEALDAGDRVLVGEAAGTLQQATTGGSDDDGERL